MHAAQQVLDISTFIVKITESNVASISLFQSVGFMEAKRLAVFEEVHLILGPAQNAPDKIEALAPSSRFTVEEFRCCEDENCEH